MALSKIESVSIEAGVIPEQLAMVATPTNSSPANAATDEGETPTLTGSTYYALYGYAHSKSQWQVSTSSGFGTTVISTGDVDNLESYTVSSGVLSTSTTYYWRVRYKNSNGDYSAWSSATSFTTASAFTYTLTYLIVGGGGSGNERNSGGHNGGAGGARNSSTFFVSSPGTNYTITVGAGGPGWTTQTNGSASSAFSVTSAGGNLGADSGTGEAGTYYAAFSGFGQPGELGYFGGGGGEGANSTPGYDGGIGGGGHGGTPDGTAYTNAESGYANTGGGGGGVNYSYNACGNGGSGVVIIKYEGSQKGSGGTVSSSGGYTYHLFTSSGTYTA